MTKLALLALALPAVACVSSGKYDSLAKQYKDCQDREGACVTERDAGKTRIAELEAQATGLTGERDAERAGRGELETKYGATQKELEDLRRQNAEAQKRLAAFKALTARFEKMISAGKLKVGF